MSCFYVPCSEDPNRLYDPEDSIYHGRVANNRVADAAVASASGIMTRAAKARESTGKPTASNLTADTTFDNRSVLVPSTLPCPFLLIF